MRLLTTITLLGVASSPALADRTGGGGGGGSGGGGGRLGQVSSGLSTATGGGDARTSGGSNTTPGNSNNECARYRDARARDDAYRVTVLERDCGYITYSADPHADRQAPTSGGSGRERGAWVDGFAGAQKVYDSDGSLTVALSVIDQRFRLNGSFTQYYETEMSGDHISMMVPEITGGVRLGSTDSTSAWLEGGVMYVKTNDPRGNSSVTGPSIGARIEHRLSPALAVVGTAEGAFLQDNVKAWTGRVGVRFHHVEAAFRVLDLSVGPALFGPELGVGF